MSALVSLSFLQSPPIDSKEAAEILSRAAHWKRQRELLVAMKRVCDRLAIAALGLSLKCSNRPFQPSPPFLDSLKHYAGGRCRCSAGDGLFAF